MTRWRWFACFVVATNLLSAAAEERYARSELHMGVEFEVVLYADDAQRADEALTKAMSRIAALDKALSDYDPDSELSKLSETSINSTSPPAVKLSDELWTVLAQSQSISRASDGAFDVTIGPLTKLWRRARRWKELPEEESLTAAKAGVGFAFLKLNESERTAQLKKLNMRLDLGGIAKGYAAEEAVKTVVGCGLSRVLVRASGDIAAADPPPGETGWRVGIAPLNADEAPSRFIRLVNRAVSTSGDARQHVVFDGRRYSHIIDPRTGECVAGRSSVTVVAKSGMVADALATAASVLGPDGALALVKKFEGAELLMVYEDEAGRQRTVESPGFP